MIMYTTEEYVKLNLFANIIFADINDLVTEKDAKFIKTELNELIDLISDDSVFMPKVSILLTLDTIYSKFKRKYPKYWEDPVSNEVSRYTTVMSICTDYTEYISDDSYTLPEDIGKFTTKDDTIRLIKEYYKEAPKIFSEKCPEIKWFM